MGVSIAKNYTDVHITIGRAAKAGCGICAGDWRGVAEFVPVWHNRVDGRLVGEVIRVARRFDRTLRLISRMAQDFLAYAAGGSLRIAILFKSMAWASPVCLPGDAAAAGVRSIAQP